LLTGLLRLAITFDREKGYAIQVAYFDAYATFHA
jgi:hypothetical protein